MGTNQLRGQSTKEKLITIVDDVEMIVKELLETTIAQKQEKLPHNDQSNLITLLMEKSKDFKSTLSLAKEQQEIDGSMHQLLKEVSTHDTEIQNLQKHLKEADTILSTALFQAKQKLDQITKAQSHQVSSEDLIRFAHRISSTNAVAAPSSWVPGDPRRPYPTDIEMRMGLLARIHDTPMSQVLDSLHPSGGGRDHHGFGSGSTSSHFQTGQPWYSASGVPGELPLPISNNSSSLFSSGGGVGSGGGMPEVVRGGSSNNNHDDVEVMSTDSSSSSSSDSQ